VEGFLTNGRRQGQHRPEVSRGEEALHLGKLYIAVPVEHSVSRFSMLWRIKAGYGAYWEELNKERVSSVILNLRIREKLEKAIRGRGMRVEGKWMGACGINWRAETSYFPEPELAERTRE